MGAPRGPSGGSSGHRRSPARIVVYRRPVETRVSDPRDVAALVADIVTEQVAGLLGVSPEERTPASATDATTTSPRLTWRGVGARIAQQRRPG